MKAVASRPAQHGTTAVSSLLGPLSGIEGGLEAYDTLR